MNIYTYSEARRKLATLLDKAAEEGEVRIRRRDGQVFIIKPQTRRRRDGQVFIIKPQTRRRSPLEVDGPDLKLTLPDILQSIQEGRKSY